MKNREFLVWELREKPMDKIRIQIEGSKVKITGIKSWSYPCFKDDINKLKQRLDILFKKHFEEKKPKRTGLLPISQLEIESMRQQQIKRTKNEKLH